LAAANATITALQNPAGTSTVLTTDSNTSVAGTQYDLIVGTPGSDTITASTGGKLQSSDIIVDGSSTDNDTLTITTTTDLTSANGNLATVAGIENVEINWGAFAAGTFEVDNIRATKFTINNTQAGSSGDATINNVATGSSVTAGSGVTGTLTIDSADGGTTVNGGSAAAIVLGDAGKAGSTITAGATTTAITVFGAGQSTDGTASDKVTVSAVGTVALDTINAAGGNDQVEQLVLSGNGAKATYTLTGSPTKTTASGDQNVTLSVAADNITAKTTANSLTGSAVFDVKINASRTGAADLDLKKVVASTITLANASAAADGQSILLKSGQKLVLTTSQDATFAVDTTLTTAAQNSLTLVADAATKKGQIALSLNNDAAFTGANAISIDVTNDSSTAVDLEATAVNFGASTVVTVTGAGAADFGGATAKTLDASASTGKITATASANMKTIKTGSANDAVIGYNGTFSVDTGAGTGDKLTVTAGIDLSDDTVTISNVEILEIGDEGGGNTKSALTFASSQVDARTWIVKGTTTTAADLDNLTVVLDTATVNLSNLTIDTTSVEKVVIDGANATGSSATEQQSITGSNAADTITVNAQNATVYGGAGVDTLTGGAGNDNLNGDAGADVIDGGNGNDSLNGGADGDTIEGNSGNDTVNGGTGDDKLSGGSGNDSLIGDTGDDLLVGGSGTDTLNGGDGVDVLVGGSGADSLTGGAGADTFVFANKASATVSTAGGVEVATLGGTYYAGQVISIVDIQGVASTTTVSYTVKVGDGNAQIGAGLVAAAAAQSLTYTYASDVVTTDSATANDVTTTITGIDVTNTGVSATGTGIDKIVGFNADEDTIYIGTNTVAGVAANAPTAGVNVKISLSGGVVTFADGDDTLAEIVTTLAADDTNIADGEVAVFEFNGNTYVYGAGTTADTATDFMIELTGVVGLGGITISSGNIYFG
jgi:Ca2+-binding RTX toxin-like protein